MRQLLLIVAGLGGLLAFTWPLIARPSSAISDAALTPLLFAAILPLVLAIVLSDLASHALDVRALAMLGVLSAVGAFLRPLGAGTAGIETVFLLPIVAGRVFGGNFGFVLGNTTLLASAVLTGGIGPWLPYQMLATGFVGLGAGLLPRTGPTGRVWREIALLAVYGVLTAFVFGALMDFAFWPFAVGGETSLSFDPRASIWRNLHVFLLYEATTSIAWNLGRAITTVALLGVLGPALLRVLRRASRRGGFAAVRRDQA